jgi:hypothetical protein
LLAAVSILLYGVHWAAEQAVKWLHWKTEVERAAKLSNTMVERRCSSGLRVSRPGC